MDEERIPGERDPGTAAPSKPGIMGGTGFGENIPADGATSLDEDTRREIEREGGGAESQRSKGKGKHHD